jgi:hypothetical protein
MEEVGVRRRVLAIGAAVLVAAVGAAVTVPAVAEADEVSVHTGETMGARFRAEVPARWNGTLLLYSHGLYSPGFLPDEIELVNQPAAKQRLLDDGYALAASLFRTPNGYPVQQALEDQVRVLDWFDAHVGRPEHVISWGASGGGSSRSCSESATRTASTRFCRCVDRPVARPG